MARQLNASAFKLIRGRCWRRFRVLQPQIQELFFTKDKIGVYCTIYTVTDSCINVHNKLQGVLEAVGEKLYSIVGVTICQRQGTCNQVLATL